MLKPQTKVLKISWFKTYQFNFINNFVFETAIDFSVKKLHTVDSA